MATDQQRLLEKTIRAAREWQKGQAPFSLEAYFFQLQEADQSENEELWQQLRAALAENRSLHNKAPQEFFTRLSLAMDGYWWWNPTEWQVDNEELEMEN